MSRICHAARKGWMSDDAVEASYDRVYALIGLCIERGDPWGKNPTVFTSGKYAEPVDPVVAGLFSTERLY